MAKISYILLCHKDSDTIIRQIDALTSMGDFVSVHIDGNASSEIYDRVVEKFLNNPNVIFAKRIKCGWGEWSLVQATLNALNTASEAFPTATHFYLVSGDCMPIKPVSFVHDFVIENECDYIEYNDFFTSNWIKTGMKEDRLVYRHWFNERKYKNIFYWSLNAQRKLGFKRKIPKGIDMMIGSQWWCLRRKTVEKILEFIKTRPDVIRFFKTTWIPDETFFQTLVGTLIPHKQIESRTLTFKMFTDYGMPVVFHNDHYDMLKRQNYLFARKISAHAIQLQNRLAKLYRDKNAKIDISNDGESQFKFLTSRGRSGIRNTKRIWETGSSIGQANELWVIVAKKWHVAKWLAESVRQTLNVKGVSYLFDETEADLPELGGFGSTLTKRSQHRRGFVRMLFQRLNTERMVICIDPENIGILRDFHADNCDLRVLLLDADLSDDFLVGHMQRKNVITDITPNNVKQTVLKAGKTDLINEIEDILSIGLSNINRIGDARSDEENIDAMARFTSVNTETAKRMISHINLGV